MNIKYMLSILPLITILLTSCATLEVGIENTPMADQAAIVVEMVSKYYPEAKQSPERSSDLHIPVV